MSVWLQQLAVCFNQAAHASGNSDAVTSVYRADKLRRVLIGQQSAWQRTCSSCWHCCSGFCPSGACQQHWPRTCYPPAHAAACCRLSLRETASELTRHRRGFLQRHTTLQDSKICHALQVATGLPSFQRCERYAPPAGGLQAWLEGSSRAVARPGAAASRSRMAQAPKSASSTCPPSATSRFPDFRSLSAGKQAHGRLSMIMPSLCL